MFAVSNQHLSSLGAYIQDDSQWLLQKKLSALDGLARFSLRQSRDILSLIDQPQDHI
jgi:hypothetical protein